MQKVLLTTLAFLFALLPFRAEAQNHKNAIPVPEQFEIGREAFFDFGPPFQFFDILIVRPVQEGTSVERISVTPPGISCLVPAKIQTSHATIKESVAELLGNENPCSIPQKEINHERKRCKKCNVFSGANVLMQVQCGANSRLIRSDILDRDWFASRPDTPKHTSWIMQLLGKLEDPLGPGVMDTPMIALPQADSASTEPKDESASVQDFAVGKFDHLFPGSQKISEFYRLAKIPPPSPRIDLIESSPVAPDLFIAPAYPPLARLTRTEGAVSFAVDINAEGSATNFVVLKGHPLLLAATQDATQKWKFPKSSEGQHVMATLEFKLNCPKEDTEPVH